MKRTRPIIMLMMAAGAMASALGASRPSEDSIASITTDSIASGITNDSIAACAASDSIAPHKQNIIQRFLAYLDDSNKPKERKAFDFGIIGGPHYSSDKGFGIGLVASGQYRTCEADSLLQPSEASLYANATTGLCFNVGLEGVNIFPNDRMRLNYRFQFESFRTYYWGIGYAMAIDDANKTRYQYFHTELEADLGFRIADHLYAGPMISLMYMQGKHFSRPQMWEGLPANTLNFGMGIAAKLEYDSRDFVTNAYHGLYLSLQQLCYPGFLGNKNPFYRTRVVGCYYTPLWRGGVLATKVDGNFTYGDTPWQLLPTFGGSNDMRGYYEGQYRDKCLITATAELRQHVWQRFGLVVWGGAGKIFPNFKGFNLRHVLPNYGVGIRWEFKKRVNIRLDYGFGRKCSGFVFSINEAF